MQVPPPYSASSVSDIHSADHNVAAAPMDIALGRKKGERLEPKPSWLCVDLLKTCGRPSLQFSPTFH